MRGLPPMADRDEDRGTPDNEQGHAVTAVPQGKDGVSGRLDKHSPVSQHG